MNDKRLIKSYVWHGDDCFFVSTIERDSSAMVNSPAPRFAETLVWEYDWDADNRGNLVHQGGTNAVLIELHLAICRHIFTHGRERLSEEESSGA